MQLVEAVVQLLDYEHATGVDLREMMYDPDDLYDQAAQSEEQENREPKGEDEGDNGAEQSETEAIADSGVVADAKESENEDEFLAGVEIRELANNGRGDITHGVSEDIAGGRAECEEAQIREDSGPFVGGEDVELSERPDGWNVVVDDAVTHDDTGCNDNMCALREHDIKPPGTLMEYAQDLGAEVLRTMKNDLNALVGLLPDPVSKLLREVATLAYDTAVNVVVPVAKQAERYTRGLRRGAVSSTGKLFMHMKEEVCPKVAREFGRTLANARRSLSDTVRRVRGNEEDEGGVDEEERVQAQDL